MTDIVDQYNSARVMPVPEEMLKDAIDEVIRLRARIAELEAALRPFADAADDLDETPHGQIIFDPDDLRAARAALEKKND